MLVNYKHLTCTTLTGESVLRVNNFVLRYFLKKNVLRRKWSSIMPPTMLEQFFKIKLFFLFYLGQIVGICGSRVELSVAFEQIFYKTTLLLFQLTFYYKNVN